MGALSHTSETAERDFSPLFFSIAFYSHPVLFQLHDAEK
jgi:hypothetical protein